MIECKFCVLLSDDGQPPKIWRIARETPRFLILEYDQWKLTQRLKVSPDQIWRLN